jgi:HAD superfamily hydrolase (TIGR01509 family)
MLASISCVLFDLGGVIVNWKDSWIIEETCVQFHLSKEIFSKEFNKNLPYLSAGKINEKEFWRRIDSKLDSTRLVKENKSIFGEIFLKLASVNKEMLELSKELAKKGITVGILSNTEDATYSVVKKTLSIKHFKFKFLSYEIGYLKPGKKIFQHVIDNIPFKKSELFFIDDMKANVDSALSLGIDSVQFSNYENLLSELLKRGIIVKNRQGSDPL